jgi:hypothetical protein
MLACLAPFQFGSMYVTFDRSLSVPTSSQSRSLSISTPVTTTTWKKLSQLPATQMGLGYDKNRFKS